MTLSDSVLAFRLVLATLADDPDGFMHTLGELRCPHETLALIEALASTIASFVVEAAGDRDKATDSVERYVAAVLDHLAQQAP